MKRIEAVMVTQLLSACASYQKPLPAVEPPQRVVATRIFRFSEGARESRLTTVVSDLPVGHRYGQVASGYGTCSEKRPLVNVTGRFNYDVTKYADVFASVMKKHGYPVDDKAELFPNSKERVADLQVAARIVDATLNACFPRMYRNELEVTGSAYLKIEWSVYSTLEKKIMYVTATEGSTYGDVESTIGEAGLLRPALADALEKLALDPKYKDVVDPPVSPVVRKPDVPRTKIKRVKEFTEDLKRHLEPIKAAVATVTANRGSGSGFVVSEDGTVLTAEHVISGSKFVKVITAIGKECYGEVVASNKQRDVAVVRVDCTGLTALPISREQIVEGTEVFAIGTPLSEKLQFSVTRGVVSGIRKIDEVDYIQSDVNVLPGSSGGPLLDSKGNVIGITSAGVAAKSVPLGVNFFVPIKELGKYVPLDFE